MSRRRGAAKHREATETITPQASPDDPVEVLVARARRLRRKGDTRRALVLLRQACALDEWRPRTYTLLGVQAAREGLVAEASQALKQARWLRARAGDKVRAAVTARLAAALLPEAA
jgi:Flp pilus assembly protein TadD